MYGGKSIAPGDIIYVFASDERGLIARGVVTLVEEHPRPAGVDRHTPRVSVAVQRTGTAQQPLGGSALKPFDQWDDGRPQTELNFKFYRQATNKIAGITDAAAAFLDAFIDGPKEG